MTLQNGGGEITLQRGEAETPPGIALQTELHQTFAEPANPVVEKDGVGGIDEHGSAREFWLSLQFRNIFGNAALLQQIVARPLLPANGAAEFGHEKPGGQRLGEGPASSLPP